MTRKTRMKEKARNARKQEAIEKDQETVEQAEEVVNDQIASESEELSKDYYSYPMLGPTSFEELDAARAAEERAHEVRMATYDVQDLVRNILYEPAEPKSQSTKIKKVASEFEQRVGKIMAQPIKKDIEVLQIESILATEARSLTLFQKGWEFVKEKLSSEVREGLSESDFALPAKRKYPIHDKVHVRNALARAAQQIEGGDDEAKTDARAALPKIRAKAKEFGIEMAKEKSALIIEKDKSGTWRWIGKPTNNFIDWQGDILSKSSHQKYVSWLDANPEMAPVFVSWHTPGTRRESKVDFWMEQDGAVIMSGPLTEEEAGRLFTVQKSVDLGMSLQAFGMRLGPDPRVVTDYWCYEVSDLPRDAAANPFTMLETMTKEVGMDKLQYLATIMGSEEEAEAFLKKTSQAQADLASAGIESKEKVEEPVKEPVTEPPAETPPATPELDAILKAVSEHFKMDDLNAFVAQAQDNEEKIEVLESLVKTLKTSKEDDLAAALTPPISKWNWAQSARASASPDTKLKKDKTPAQAADEEDLSKAAPGVPEGYWLSEVTNTAPITQ